MEFILACLVQWNECLFVNVFIWFALTTESSTKLGWLVPIKHCLNSIQTETNGFVRGESMLKSSMSKIIVIQMNCSYNE